jgi:hypothetical protein
MNPDFTFTIIPCVHRWNAGNVAGDSTALPNQLGIRMTLTFNCTEF